MNTDIVKIVGKIAPHINSVYSCECKSISVFRKKRKVIKYTSTIKKEEAELVLFIKNELKNKKLTPAKMKKLFEMIDEFGSERYSEGQDDATQHDESY